MKKSITLYSIIGATLIPMSMALAENPSNRTPGPYKTATSEQIEQSRPTAGQKYTTPGYNNESVRDSEATKTGTMTTPDGVAPVTNTTR